MPTPVAPLRAATPARPRPRRVGTCLTFSLTALACLLIGRPAFAACDGTPIPSGLQRLDVGTLSRTFIARQPSEGDGRTPAPVVIAFHPFGMNAQYMATRAPIGRFWPQAVVLYPDGLGRDAGSRAPSWQGRAGELGDRDLAFFDALLAWLDSRGCIDRARVFVLGYSNGAGLAYLLGCERGNAVAGVAIAAGRLGCRPQGAKPVVMSHGVGDSTIPYAQAVEASTTWAAVNGCAAPPKPGTAGCVAAASCTGAPVTLCTHGGGHEYDVSFTRVVAEFFRTTK